MNNKLFKLFCLPRSLYWNFRFLPFKQAIKCPILIGRKVTIKVENNAKVKINGLIKTGMIQLGIGLGSFDMGRCHRSFLQIKKNSNLIFNGTCQLSKGFKIMISRGGCINIGNKVHLNSFAMISSNSLVMIGNGVRSGWNCTIIDWDGHNIIDTNTKKVINNPRNIIIGENCWLGSHSTILKGVELKHHTIIPYGSIILKSNDIPYSVYGGQPNKTLKENVKREF